MKRQQFSQANYFYKHLFHQTFRMSSKNLISSPFSLIKIKEFVWKLFFPETCNDHLVLKMPFFVTA